MPQFVQSVANQQTPPPYHFPGIRAHAFVIDIQMDAVQAYCDTYFNLGEASERGFVYGPMSLWPYALLMVVEYPMMINSNRTELGYAEVPFADRGYSSQNEVFLAVPLVRRGTTLASLMLRAAVEWALPFIVVNNTTSAFSGREILGLEKLWGIIGLGKGSFPNGFSASVEIPGWPSLSPDAQQTIRRVIHIQTGSPLPAVGHASADKSPWTTLQSPPVLQAFETLANVFDSVTNASNGIIPTPMRLVALKQFRDAVDPHKAIYQALVGARSRYYDISDLTLYNEQDVSIALQARGSFAEIAEIFRAGAADGPTDDRGYVTLPARAAFAFTADLDFDEMCTLHTFPVDDEVCDPVDEGGAGMLSPGLRPWWGLVNAATRKPSGPAS